MEDNIYSPPTAVVADAPVAIQAQKFYAVSPLKFWVLMMVTLGIYRLYWFYKHWSNYKRVTGESMWPVMRSIFSVFFTHALFREIEAEIGRVRSRHDWNGVAWATLYVVATVGENVIDRVERFGCMSLAASSGISMLILIAAVFAAYQGQRAANAAIGDPEGRSNARFTIANWCWIVFGLLFWSMALIGLSLPPEALEG